MGGGAGGVQGGCRGTQVTLTLNCPPHSILNRLGSGPVAYHRGVFDWNKAVMQIILQFYGGLLRMLSRIL